MHPRKVCPELYQRKQSGPGEKNFDIWKSKLLTSDTVRGSNGFWLKISNIDPNADLTNMSEYFSDASAD